MASGTKTPVQVTMAGAASVDLRSKIMLETESEEAARRVRACVRKEAGRREG